jgi:hypothetical protein
MQEEDQERFEDYLELERWIAYLSGRVALPVDERHAHPGTRLLDGGTLVLCLT